MTQRLICLIGLGSRITKPREAICLFLIWATAFAPIAHAGDLGMAPQATLYVALPFQTGKELKPELGFRLSYESVLTADPKYSAEPVRVLDFRLRQDRDASVLSLNGVPLNAKPSGGRSDDTTFWIVVGVAIGVAAVLIISNHDGCNPKPGNPC
ncbi:MAG: hypothetical protein HY067_09240 [Betaproteobacteria bacterium]|nr:hypothetical protein [Betaproteobacteria bacterium]